MLIALLAVLGVDLWVIVVLLAVVLARKRWVRDLFVWTKTPFLSARPRGRVTSAR